MALTTQQQTELYKLGVGMYNASLGTTYMNELATAVDAGMSIEAIYNALANSAGFQALNSAYGSFATNAQFATAFTDQLTGGTLAAADRTWVIDYVTTQLAGGRSRGSVMKELVDALDAIPSTHATLGNAAARFDNRVTVARDYTEVQNGSATSISTLQNTIASVDQTSASVTAAIDANAGASGQTFNLTTGVDSLVGTSGNDTFVAVLSGAPTFQVGDSVNGGAGSNDTLRIVNTTANIDTATATVTNVERLQVVNTGALATLDGDSDGYTSVTLDKMGAADLTISGIAATTAVTVGEMTGQKLTLTYDSVTGTSDTASVTVGKAVTGAGIVAAGIETFNLTTTGASVINTANALGDAKAININAGAATTFSGFTTAANATVTVTGSGAVDLGTLKATVKAVDASASTSGITATTDAAQTSVKGGAGKDSITVGAQPTTTLTLDAGAGNDTVTVSALDLTVASVIDGTNVVIGGGDGTDTLVLNEGDLTNANLKTNVSKTTGFEVLQAANAVSAFAANGFTSINEFVFAGNNTNGGNVTYTMEGSDKLTLTASNSTNTMTINPVLDSGTDVLNLTLSASTANLTQNAINVAQIETLNLTSVDTNADAANSNTITTLTVQNNTTINVTASNALTFTTATGQTLTINGATSTGKLDITASAGNDVITGGSAADVIRAGGGQDTIDGGAGNDTLFGGGGKDTIIGGAGDDIIQGDGVGVAAVTAVAEVQTFKITGEPTADGNITVAGGIVAILDVDTIDDIGGKIAAQQAAIKAATATIDTVTYDAATDTVTITYLNTAGNVGLAAVAAGATGTTFDAVAEATAGVAAAAATIADGGQTASADILTGGEGNDVFRFVAGLSNDTATDTITDLNLGTDALAGRVDTLVFQNAGATVTIDALTVGEQANVTAAANLTAALGLVATAAAADGATTQFTFGTDTYLFHNVDGNGTYDAAADIVIKITGVVGTLDTSDISVM